MKIIFWTGLPAENDCLDKFLLISSYPLHNMFTNLLYQARLTGKIVGSYSRVFYISVVSNWAHPPPPPPPGNVGENFFERANRGHPGKFFCLISCPGQKKWSNSPGVGQNFPKPKKLLRIKLAKVLKKLRRLRDSKTTRKSLNTPALIFN